MTEDVYLDEWTKTGEVDGKKLKMHIYSKPGYETIIWVEEL